jgi:two-component system, OmpR family, sensor histidine kinase KdpD
MTAPTPSIEALRRPPALHGAWLGVLVWTATAAALWGLDGHLELGSQALLVVLAAALSALWLPPAGSMAASALAVFAFNVAFVPPRGTWAVHLRHDALLLLTTLAVSWLVALLVARQRQAAEREHLQAQRATQLRELGEALRDARHPNDGLPQLQQALSAHCGPDLALLLPPDGHDALPTDPEAWALIGPAGPHERVGLWLVQQRGQPMGPGTGRHEEEPAWYLPLQGRSGRFGAAWLPVADMPSPSADLRGHLQALCDQFGVALEREAESRHAAQAHEAAQAQALRNTLLASIAHDHRTPLATILGAASSLHDQGERLDPAQRRQLAASIVDEATQLARLTDNTLQLARLDAPGIKLQTDWQSAEELVGTVLARVRRRHPGQRVKAHVEPALPLLRCDAVLVVQLLDNLIDNALKHGHTNGLAPEVELNARRAGDQLRLAVRDRGPGVPEGRRERLFEPFQRGEASSPGARGAGVGLALCRAIAQAHGGTLVWRAREGGGSSFELMLPVDDAP